jgi:hypothetical protein
MFLFMVTAAVKSQEIARLCWGWTSFSFRKCYSGLFAGFIKAK